MSARGTTNTNARGSSATRRRRREWLVETFRADVDVNGEHACRCYRCGKLLTTETVSPDRITPGCKGGTYKRGNIRPACLGCQSITGNYIRTWRPAIPNLASVTVVDPPARLEAAS